jgi:putative protein kinase ArgK-like GTPase of G3E family
LKDPLEPSFSAPRRGQEWKRPILSASALQRKGVAQIFSSILSHQKFLSSSGEMRDRLEKQVSAELLFILEKKLHREVQSALTDKILDRLTSRKTDPHTLSREILSALKRKQAKGSLR